MSLFRREPENPTRSDSPSQRRDLAPPERLRQGVSPGITHIAPGTRVQGQITGDTEVLIDGVLEGDVHVSSRAVVGSEGKVVGTLQARSLRVAGRVEGNVSCLERVEILESGTLEGDVTAPRVVISEGAFFKGKVEMNEPRKAGGQAPQSPNRKKTTPIPTESRAGVAADESEGKR